jgi:hypothetical protein
MQLKDRLIYCKFERMKLFVQFLYGLVSVSLFISFYGCKKSKRYGIDSSSVDQLKASSVILSAFALRKGFEKISHRGFCYATHPSPEISDSIIYETGCEAETGKAGVIRAEIKNLGLHTTYYARAFSILKKGKIIYGEQLRFTTNDQFITGDTGPAGGLIFYENGNEFMEVVVTNLPAAEWGCKGTLLKIPTIHDMKYAKSNTEGIATECSAPGTAAKACLLFEVNGFSEWYLPTRMDLAGIWKVHQKTPVSGFNPAAAVYWSSTQLDKDFAYAFDFSSGKEVYNSVKSSLHPIIVVRKF